jgi:hypothetical protein
MMPAHITRLMTFAQHGEPKGYAASDMMRADLEALILSAHGAATRSEVLSDVDPVVLECWKLQDRKVGAMLREAQAAVIELQEQASDGAASGDWFSEQKQFEASALFEGRAHAPERFPGQPWRYTSEFDQWQWAGWIARAGSAVGAVHEGVTGERAMLKALFAHWNEFDGPEHGFGELMDKFQTAFAALASPPPSPKTGEGSAIRDALRLMQEMWDELDRRKLNRTLMRQYADALSVLEKDFLKRIAEGEGFIGGGDSTRVTDAMVEAGAKALAGSMADPHNAAWGRKWARAVLEAAHGVREDGNV